MRIVVTGGAGDLGSRVVTQATARGHEVVSASRRSGVDLSTGAGLAAALDGADAVVNCADAPGSGDAVTVDGAQRLAEAAAAATPPMHLVQISIVGIDDFPMTYYRRKLAAEHAIEQTVSAVDGQATVLRATQFHSLAAFFARALTKGPFVLRPGRMAFQPVDTDWVAGRLLDLATGPAPDGFARATDVAGPEVLDVPELAALVREHAGRARPRALPMPALVSALRAFGRGQNLPDPEHVQTGGRRFVDWLADQPAVLTGR